MRVCLFAAICLTLLSAQNKKETPMTHRATGTFEVKLKPLVLEDSQASDAK